jgi:peroxiredoxin (alkyl hydroperoxide reductase subunit C)
MTNGRNTEEILRLVQALQVTDKFNVVTPANWVPGQSVLVPAAKTYEELLERENHPKELGLACEDWFWCYKNLPENVEED